MALRKLLAIFGVKFDDKELKKGKRATDDAKDSLVELDGVTEQVSDGIKAMGAAIVGALTIGGMRDLVTSTLEASNELLRWSQRLQINAQDLEAWIQIGSRYGGTVDDVTDALKELQLKATDAIRGGESQAEMFEIVGLSLDDLRPVYQDATALADLFSDALSRNTNVAEQAFAVDELMSDAGTRLIDVFRNGGDELRRQRRELIASNRSTMQLQEETRLWNREAADLNITITRLRNSIVVRFLPGIRRVMGVIESVVEWFDRLKDETKIVEAAIIGLSVVAVAAAVATIGAWGPAVLTFGIVALGVAALVLLIEELIVTVQGGDSYIRRFNDALRGTGATQRDVETLTDSFEDLKQVLQDIWEFLEPIIDAIGSFVGTVSGFVGTVASELDLALPFAEQRGRVEETFGAQVPVTPLQMLRGFGNIRRGLREARAGGARARQEMGAQQDFPYLREEFPDVFAAPGDIGQGMSFPQTQSVQQTVDARSSFDITINEATDAAEVDRRVRRSIREANDEQIRNVQTALVPEGQQ
jgi:hypothetical protein